MRIVALGKRWDGMRPLCSHRGSIRVRDAPFAMCELAEIGGGNPPVPVWQIGLLTGGQAAPPVASAHSPRVHTGLQRGEHLVVVLAEFRRPA